MIYKTEAEWQPLYEFLKRTHVPPKGAAFFFDLSKETYCIHLLSSVSEMCNLVGLFVADNIPYAIIKYFEGGEPTYIFHGVTFCKIEDLKTEKIIEYHNNIHIKFSIEDVRKDLQRLKAELDNPKAS